MRAYRAITPQTSRSSCTELPWSVRMADSMLRRHPVSLMRWRYEDGFLMRAIEQVGLRTGEPRYWQAVVDYVDRFVNRSATMSPSPMATSLPTAWATITLTRSCPAGCCSRSTRPAAKRGSAGDLPLARAVAPAAAHAHRRLLAQADLPLPDVARRHLHGVSLLCPIRRDLR